MIRNLEKNNIKLLFQIYYTFLKLGTFGFGGGFALVTLMEKKIVDEKKWMSKENLIDVFGISQCLPGAIALNASGFVGYSTARVPGALFAMLGNITSPVIVVLTLSILFEKFSSYPVVQHAFNGIRPAIIGLITYSAYKFGKTVLNDNLCTLIAVIAFVGILFLHLHPILLIVMGAIAGIILTNIKKNRSLNILLKEEGCK